jgi:integrase
MFVKPTVRFVPINGTLVYTRPMKRKGKTVTRKGAPTIQNGTLPPRRRSNAAVRPREFLTGEEVEQLRKACGERLGRYAHRDSTMILIAYRHGLRVSELVALRWDMIDLSQGHMHVRRLKNGRPSTHILRGTEIRGMPPVRNAAVRLDDRDRGAPARRGAEPHSRSAGM